MTESNPKAHKSCLKAKHIVFFSYLFTENGGVGLIFGNISMLDYIRRTDIFDRIELIDNV